MGNGHWGPLTPPPPPVNRRTQLKCYLLTSRSDKNLGSLNNLTKVIRQMTIAPVNETLSVTRLGYSRCTFLIRHHFPLHIRAYRNGIQEWDIVQVRLSLCLSIFTHKTKTTHFDENSFLLNEVNGTIILLSNIEQARFFFKCL